jgi:hypothetical protein
VHFPYVETGKWNRESSKTFRACSLVRSEEWKSEYLQTGENLTTAKPELGYTRQAAIRLNKPSTSTGELPFSVLALALS